MCGLIAAEGLVWTVVWKNYSQRLVGVWMHCGESGMDGGWRKAGRNEMGMCGLIAAEGLAWTLVWKKLESMSGGRVDVLRRKRHGHQGFGKLDGWGVVITEEKWAWEWRRC
jgi:hypothetical protein